MRFVVASQSKIKIAAVENALKTIGLNAEVVGVKAKSGVNEQPIDQEVYDGAEERLADAKRLSPGADLYIAIENGLLTTYDGEYVDRAITVASTEQETEMTLAESESVKFPKQYVEEARNRGFKTTTVGQVMQEKGIVVDHADPHLSLSGTSRAAFIEEALTRLLLVKAELLGWLPGEPSDSPSEPPQQAPQPG